MTKAEIVAHAASAAGVTKKAAGDVVDAFLMAVVSTVKKGDSITLTGFGTYSRAARKARTGVNPQTRAKITIPARKVPKFSAGKAFREAVR